ncbi:MAG: alginate export family protein [Methylococcaceae bacterium]|nr:alginate export family protein [Methylococcaceae bacterium]
MSQKTNCFFVLVLLLGCAGLHAQEKSKSPWTLHDAAGLPKWLKFSVEQRTRYEGISNSFRANTRGGDQVFAFRTLVFLEATYEQFRVGGEFADSRIDNPTSNTPVNNTLVNEVAMLQAYLAWQSKDFLDSGLGAEIKFGRQTLNIGSRRLVARNAMRNTINNFDGINFILNEGKHWQWWNFVVLPVTRLPTDPQSIRDGIVQFDEENFDTIFAGSFLSVQELPLDSIVEVYFYQLSEDDGPNIQTANRNLSTPGIRWFREPETSEFDFELESALQTGTSRTTTAASNRTTLDQFSYFGHVALGYTFDYPWSPRLLLQYDYASGDADPNDGKNGRFDTLFGARRFEYGPTSIWGAFARSNINTPGVRLLVKPMADLSAMIAHRAYWLAEKRDTWVGSDLRDPTGRSGSFIGQQLEAQMIWNAIPKLLALETGWAHLFKGDFAKNAPRAPVDHDDADYFYVQTTLWF